MHLAGRSRCFAAFCVLFVTLIASPKLFAGPPVVLADPLTPQEQQKKFKLPPGFEIQLVAAEPDIQKPMNLAFDAKGRLWVTHSSEYPFAAKDVEKSKDALSILEGIGPDGRATKVTQFADKLNIPIGVLPLPNCNEAIVWSIPNIWKLSDTDGDGKADKREVLYGPFDFVDTHGNQNAFRLGNDGWVYACHGFRNSSKIKLRGEGPVVLEMNSGNAYRFKIDGSAIEQISWGQVNPFGLAIDQRGDLFTADCHSKPITMLLRGGYHDSFGKPDDGLGFVPITTSNDHGSTGIAGVVSYVADHFPKDYSESMFVGNVVTNIVHRDKVQYRGSSPWVEHPEDFLTSDDWWFHPVDVQLGPEGALYISDFYNSIIGHYEVDLLHPRRDKYRGRIWRVVYTGSDKKNPIPAIPDLTKASLQELVKRLSDPNATVRNLAIYQIDNRFGPEGVDAILELITQRGPADGAAAERFAAARSLGLWLLWRKLPYSDAIVQKLCQDPAELVRIHMVRILGETPNWSPAVAELVRTKMTDKSPFVQRAAAEALGRHPSSLNLQPLVQLWRSAPEADVQLIHATRIAIRNQLRPADAINQIADVKLGREELERVAEIALAVPSEAAAWFTFDYIRRHEVAQDVVEKCLQHVARYVGQQRLDEVAEYVQKKFPNDMFRQTTLFQSLFNGLNQRGAKLSADSILGKWAASLATRLLDPKHAFSVPWENRTLPGIPNANTANPWDVRHRDSTDGQGDALFFDSISNGEQLTGVLTSAPFVIPEHFSFWMCGHNGLPGTNPPAVNHVRLKLLETGDVIAQQVPPRNDVAHQYKWDLKKWAGQRAVFEIVDADTGGSYAWLAVGRFEPGVVANPVAGLAFTDSSLITAIQLADQLKLANLGAAVLYRLRNANSDLPVRVAAARAALNLDRGATISGLITIVQTPTEPAQLRITAAQLLGSVNTQPTRLALTTALSTAPGALQQPIALSMASTREGGETLFNLIAAGKASALLLQDKPILDRLNSVPIPDRDKRIAELTQGLTQPDERLKQLTAKLAASIAGATPPPEAGLAILKKSCLACHRLNNEGGKIGPQLDGVGNRGLERMLEDVLDPNRNVDGAFRATIVAQKSGLVTTGLKLREEGGAIILGNNEGKEVRIPLDEIEESRTSNLSIMPPNFAQQLSEADLQALISFLLSQKQAVEPK